MSDDAKKTVYYKAFEKGLICRGKEYQENTEYEEAGADECCKPGMMHFCENPLDVLNYYPLIGDDGELSEFATVEPLAEVKKGENKCASRKIRIGAKLSLKGFIEAAVHVLIEKTKCDDPKNAASGDYSQLAMSGKNSVGASIGICGKAKGTLGCWIVLAEWEHRDGEGWVPLCVKAGKIDGETLKPDTWYQLANGQFAEVDGQ